MTTDFNIFRTTADTPAEPKQPSVLDTLKDLTAQTDRLLTEAKQEAFANAGAAILQLNELGFRYFLGRPEREKKAPRRAQAEKENTTRHKPNDAPCPICSFKTEPPHDRRSHKKQAEKRPFNENELKALGMARIS
jgi:hypothetical protein